MNFPVQYQVIFGSNHPEIGVGMAKLLSDPIVRLDLAANAGWVHTAGTPGNPDYVYSAPVALSSFDMIADGGYAGASGVTSHGQRRHSAPSSTAIACHSIGS